MDKIITVSLRHFIVNYLDILILKDNELQLFSMTLEGN